MIRVRLYNPTRMWTAAASPNGGRVAWPLQPWTVLAALVAGAHELDDPGLARAAVGALAAADDPVMWLPDLCEHRVPMRYVGLTGVQGAKSHWRITDASVAVSGMSDGRHKHELHEARGEWCAPTAFLDWPDVLDAEQTEQLAAAARRVPYVGRSTDAISVGVLAGGPDSWYDHTAAGGRCDAALASPGPDHTRWGVTDASGPTHCATSETLAQLDANWERTEAGLRSLPAHVTGTLRLYLPTVEQTMSHRVVLRVEGRPTAADVLTELSELNDDEAPFAIGGRRPWAYSFPGADTAARAVAALPGRFSGGVVAARHVEPWHGQPTIRWRTVAPVAAHPNERAALAELSAALPGHVEVQHAGRCPELPHLALWNAVAVLDQPLPGPIQVGAGAEYGYGRFRKDI